MRHVGPVHMQHMNVVPCKDVVDYLHYAVYRLICKNYMIFTWLQNMNKFNMGFLEG